MPKNPHVRTLIDSQHVKVSKRLLQSARQYFSHIFDSCQTESAPKILF